MQDFLKGVKNLGAKAKTTLKDIFTLTEEEKKKGKKANVLESTTKTVGDFFKPTEKVRVRDVVREVPTETKKLGKEILKGFARFGLSAGESAVRIPAEIAQLVNPSTRFKIPLYDPEDMTLPGIGPIESYQNQAKRQMQEGKTGGGEVIKTAGNIAMDEPIGTVLKPFGIAFGALMKGRKGLKAEEEALRTIFRGQNQPEFTVSNGTVHGGVEGRAFSSERGQAEPYAYSGKGNEPTLISGTIPESKILKGEDLSKAEREKIEKLVNEEAEGFEDGAGVENVVDALAPIAKTYGKEAIDLKSFGVTAEKGAAEGEVRLLDNATSYKGTGSERLPDFSKRNVPRETPKDVKQIGEAMQEGSGGTAATFQVLEDIVSGKTTDPVAFAKTIEDYGDTELGDVVKNAGPEKIRKIMEEAITTHKSNAKPRTYTLYRISTGKPGGVTYWTEDKKIAEGFRMEDSDVVETLNIKENDPRVLMNWRTAGDLARKDSSEWIINNVKTKAPKTIKGPVSRVTPKAGMKSVGDILGGGGEVKPPVKRVATPGTTPKGDPERKFITRTRGMAPEIGDMLDGKYKRKSNTELVAEAERLIADDYMAAQNLARTETSDQAVAVATKMIEDELTIATKATDEATKNKAYALAAEIANDAAKNLTEAGRTVQAATLLGKMTPEGMARYAARKIQQYNEEAGKRTLRNFMGGAKKIPELTGVQMKEITDAMEDINKMEDAVEKARALQKLGEKIQSYIPSSLYKKIINLWKAGLLTGLKTTGVNVMSNFSHAVSEIAKDVPASFVDKVASLFTGKRTLVLTGKGAGKGAAEGVAKGWDYLKTGFDERNIADKLDYHKVNFGKGPVAKVLKGYTDTVFGLLGAEDQPFYYAAKMRALANQAAAMAKNEGLKGKAARDFAQDLIENPTDDMVKYATLDAETAVFQQDSWLARKAQNLQKGLEIVLPFAKTPANVANAMINYSPVGIVKTIIENIGKGRFDQRLFSQGIGRGLTGTGALAIGAALMGNKMMNLTTPTSEKEREQWELEGRIPNSIKVGGKWRNIGVLGPLGMVLIVGGHLREGIEKTGSFAGGLAQSAAGFGSALTEQSFLSGVNRAIDALKDPNRSFDGFASSLAGSVIPTLIADIARGMDQYERRTDGMLERIQSRIPGAREGLEPQVDAFGKKRETPNILEVMADPTRPGNPAAENDPVTKELRRLLDADYGVTPTQLGDRNGYESLSPEENTYLWQMTGQVVRKEMEDFMRSKAYGRYDDEQKSQALDKVIQDAKVETRARVVLKALEKLPDAEQKKKLAEMKEDGLLTKSVFSMYLSLKRKQ